MSDEKRTDLLARYVLVLFERVEKLEREITALRLGSVPAFEIVADLPDARTQLERFLASTPPQKSTERQPPRQPQQPPLSKRDPAVAERWARLRL